MSYLSLDVYHGSKNLEIFSDKSKRIDLFKQVTRFVVVPALKSFPDNFDWISVSGLFLPSTSPHFPKCLIVVVSFLPWYVIYRFSYVFHVAPRIIVDINFWLRKNENILHNCYRPLRCWRFCLFQKSCWGSSDFIATTFFNVRWNYIFIFTAIFFYFILFLMKGKVASSSFSWILFFWGVGEDWDQLFERKIEQCVNRYPADTCQQTVVQYSPDRDYLFSWKGNPPLEQPGADRFCHEFFALLSMREEGASLCIRNFVFL